MITKIFALLLITSALTASEERLSSDRLLVIEEARTAAEQNKAIEHGLSFEQLEMERITNGSNHSTKHKGSYHMYSGVSAYADQVELEDGSLWFVLPFERESILEWIVGDPLAIFKGDKNSNYRYRLHNERTNHIVEVELSSAPFSTASTA